MTFEACAGVSPSAQQLGDMGAAAATDESAQHFATLFSHLDVCGLFHRTRYRSTATRTD